MKIKELRGKTTQKEISKILNIPVKNLSNYEVGRSEPDVETMIKLADYFDVSLDFLCSRPYNNQIGYVPENKKETVRKLLKLADKQFDKADIYITALLDANED